MNRPQDLRKQAAALRAEAESLRARLSEGENQETELRQLDETLTKAEALVGQAEEIERREDRLNQFDARVRARKAETEDRRPGDYADEFDRDVQTRSYSLLRIARAAAERRPLDGWEAEVSKEIEKRTDRPAQGTYVPWGLPYDRASAHRGRRALGVEHRDLDTTTGAGAVPTIKPQTIIDYLRAKTVLVQAGAELLTDLVGNFSIPKQTGVETFAWVAQGSAPSASNLTIGTVDLTPKTGAARTLITRRMLFQPSIDVEMYARQSLVKATAVGVDVAGLAGAVANPQLSPIGLINRTGVVAAASLGTDGGALTWAAVLALESLITNNNAGEMLKYVTNPKVVGAAKGTVKAGTFPVYLMGDDFRMNGYEVLSTSSVPSNLTKGSGSNLSALLCGDFTQLIIGTWGALDILTDPYTSGGAGSVNLYALQDLDIIPKHDGAFSKLVDIVTG